MAFTRMAWRAGKEQDSTAANLRYQHHRLHRHGINCGNRSPAPHCAPILLEQTHVPKLRSRRKAASLRDILPAPIPHPATPYSCLSVIIGSTRVARNAGR
jgi:hypothetical protein